MSNLINHQASQQNNEENIKCYVRCKPLSRAENELGSKCIKITNDNQTIEIDMSTGSKVENKKFNFDGIFNDSASQELIFNELCLPLISSLISGYNCTVFAYGQTGAGKTHTILGPIASLYESPNSKQGFIPRILNYIFDKETIITLIKQSIDNNEYDKEKVDINFNVNCSCLEIYQEHLVDLLSTSDSNLNEEKLAIREDVNTKSMYIENLTKLEVKDAQSAKQLLINGMENRHVASTKMNSQSSRSHLIFTIFIEVILDGGSGKTIKRHSRLNLIDLAGSERQKATEALGERIKEAGNINKSLSILGNVINSLIDPKAKFIPFRDSKLTYFLKDSLGGNSKTVIIANISQNVVQLQETLSTLKFIQRAKMIKNKSQINQEISDVQKISMLENEIKKLKEIINNNNIMMNNNDKLNINNDNNESNDNSGDEGNDNINKNNINNENNNNSNIIIINNKNNNIIVNNNINIRDQQDDDLMNKNKYFREKNNLNFHNNNEEKTKKHEGMTEKKNINMINKYNENKYNELINKFNEFIGYEEQISKKLKFLDVISFKSIKSFIEKKNIFEDKMNKILTEYNNNINEINSINHNMNNSAYLDRTSLSDNYFDSKLSMLRKELDIYKSVNEFYLNRETISNCEKIIDLNYVKDLTNLHNELETYFSNVFNIKNIGDNQIELVNKKEHSKSKEQLNQLVDSNEELKKQIESLENDNFLLNMELLQYKEEDQDNNNNSNNEDKFDSEGEINSKKNSNNLTSTYTEVSDFCTFTPKKNKVNSRNNNNKNRINPYNSNINTNPLMKEDKNFTSKSKTFFSNVKRSCNKKINSSYKTTSLKQRKLLILQDNLDNALNVIKENEFMINNLKEKIDLLETNNKRQTNEIQNLKDENDILNSTNLVFKKDIINLNNELKNKKDDINNIQLALQKNNWLIDELNFDYECFLNKINDFVAKKMKNNETKRIIYEKNLFNLINDKKNLINENNLLKETLSQITSNNELNNNINNSNNNNNSKLRIFNKIQNAKTIKEMDELLNFIYDNFIEFYQSYDLLKDRNSENAIEILKIVLENIELQKFFMDNQFKENMSITNNKSTKNVVNSSNTNKNNNKLNASMTINKNKNKNKPKYKSKSPDGKKKK